MFNLKCPLVFRIDERESMASISMHVPVGRRNSPVAHGNRYLMKSFRKQSPEIPVIARTAHIGSRIALQGMIQIRKFQGIPQKEDRSIITDQIPVSFLRIEFNCKATDITFRICRTTFTGHCGKTDKNLCLFSYLR